MVNAVLIKVGVFLVILSMWLYLFLLMPYNLKLLVTFAAGYLLVRQVYRAIFWDSERQEREAMGIFKDTKWRMVLVDD